MALNGLIIAVLLVGAISFAHTAVIDRENKGKLQTYRFGYDQKNDQGFLFTEEDGSGDGDIKRNSGFIDEHGNYQETNYTANHEGFESEVKTKVGIDNKDSEDEKLYADHQYPDHHGHHYHDHDHYDHHHHDHHHHHHGHHHHGHHIHHGYHGHHHGWYS